MAPTVITVVGRDPTMFVGGGSDTYARAFGRAAIQAGFDPHHFCVGRETRVEPTGFGTLHVAKSPFRPFRGLMLTAHAPFILASIDKFVGSCRGPWLIHSFGAWSGVGVAAARRLSRRGVDCTTVATPFTTHAHETRGKVDGLSAEHGLWARLRTYWELIWIHATVNPSERRGLRESAIVLANYDSVRAIIEAEHGAGINFGKLTYSAETAFLRDEDEEVTEPAAIKHLEPADAPLIVAVSRHDPRKGLHVLLHALSELRASGVSFRACLLGRGALLERHRKLAADLGLLASTALPGRVPDAYAYLRKGDIFVLPSLEEGSGSVSLLEAMQAGIAPVVSRIDGLPEDVVEGESGLMVEPGNISDLSRALRRLIEDRELRTRIARGARKVFRDRFSANAFAADIGQAYADLGFIPALRPPSRDTSARAAAAAGYIVKQL